MKKVYVILVAVDFKEFNHYCKEPQSFYTSEQEAIYQMKLLVKSNEFEESQIKVVTFWKINTSNS